MGSFLSYSLDEEGLRFTKNAGAGDGGLPVTAATQEPHDLPGGLILPFREQTTSVG